MYVALNRLTSLNGFNVIGKFNSIALGRYYFPDRKKRITQEQNTPIPE